ANDAGGALSTGACEDVTQPETADAADPSQAASIEGHCHRERLACQLGQLRPQGGHDRDGEVRGDCVLCSAKHGRIHHHVENPGYLETECLRSLEVDC